MTPASKSKRLVCTTCLRPQSACIFQWIRPVAHKVEVLILQHSLEVDNAKGSARLLHLSLPHSRLVTGEVFDLPALLKAPLKPEAGAGSPKHAILLYPDTPQDKALGLPAPALDTRTHRRHGVAGRAAHGWLLRHIAGKEAWGFAHGR